MRSLLRFLVVGVLALGLAGLARAADDKKEMDKKVYDLLAEVINKGADLYNGGDPAGCYHLYRGALIALKPMVDYRPEWQKAITDGMAAADRESRMDARAYALRYAIDKIRDDVVPPKTTTTLWDRLGGEKGVSKVVDDFVDLTGKDPKVNFFRTGTDKEWKPKPDDVARLKKRLVEFVSSVSGGPLKYTGDLKAAHKGMKITDEEFDASVADLKAALEKNGVKADDARAVLAAVEGTRKEIVEAKKPDEAKTLWERLGGEKNVIKVVDDFVKATAANPKVNFFRKGTDKEWKPKDEDIAKLKKSLVEFISSATGGPLKYTGPDMKTVHKGMKITDAEFDAAVADLKKALEDNGAKPDDVKTVLAAVEGTRKDIVEVKKDDDKKLDGSETVGGKVTFSGKPLDGGTVTFTSAKGSASGKIDKDGTYKVEKLEPGEYVVTVSDQPGGTVKVPVKYGDAKTSALTIEVKKGEKAPKDLDLK
jgi:truncated hemoglobin YjbI